MGRPGSAAFFADRPKVTTAPPLGVQPSVGQVFKSMSVLSLAVAGGFIVALLSSFLPWLSYPGGSYSAWGGNGRYQIADWLGMNSPLDAIIVLVLACGGAFMLVAPLFGKAVPRIPHATAIAGAALGVIGILEFLFINRIKFSGVGVGLGVLLLIAAGATAAICSFVEQRRMEQILVGHPLGGSA